MSLDRHVTLDLSDVASFDDLGFGEAARGVADLEFDGGLTGRLRTAETCHSAGVNCRQIAKTWVSSASSVQLAAVKT